MNAFFAIVAALLILLAQPFQAQALEPEKEPPNPEFAHIMERIRNGDLEPGLVPLPVTIKQKPMTPMGLQILRANLPASFDLRNTGRITAIRDQGSCGACWSFATMASIESALMPGESLDFSEDNLKNNHGFDLGPCAGGNHMMSTAYLARGAGPVLESDDPYETGSTTSQTIAARKWLRNMAYLPARTGSLDNEFLKQAVMDHGGVYTSHYTSTSTSHYKSSTAAHYYSGTTPANHAVVIVGWDDNYPAANFPSPPPGNGAFIIKNSWGTSFGEKGYFYVSYYDSKLGYDGSAYSFGFGQAGAYSQIYQYDTLGWTSTYGSGSSPSYGNVFPVQGSTEQDIFAVSTYAAAPATSYTIRVYKNPASGSPVNASGPVAEVSGTSAESGYFTVDLPTPVRVSPGEKFSVVVKVSTTSGTTYLVPVEAAQSNYSSKATSASGRSYMSGNGTSWTDMGQNGRDVCVKAFARAAGSAPADPDSDGDGLDDAWERQYFGDLAQTGAGDYEQDGLSNLKEYELGTNPAKADTDGDGMPDGWEVTYSLNPKSNDAAADSDGDGLTNLQEYSGGTNPNQDDGDSGGDDSGGDDSGGDDSGGDDTPDDGGNTPKPTANAGQDVLVRESGAVRLSGAAGGVTGASLAWAQTAGPSVSLSSTTSAQPTFTAPQVGPNGALLTFRLTVSAGGQSVSDTCLVRIMDNDTPQASAGQDQHVQTGASVTLNGSHSRHPQNGAMTYAWEQIGTPAVQLDNPNAATVSFTAPATPAALTFKLTVSTSGSAHATTDICRVFVGMDGTPPLAEAGPVRTAQPGGNVTLDGSASAAQASGSIAYYAWTQVAGTAVDLMDADTDKPYFTAPNSSAWGESLAFEITVTDANGLSSSDQVVVNVLGSLNQTAPKARAGADVVIDGLSEYRPDAAASSDDQTENLAYEWLQIAGSPVAIADPASAAPVIDLADAQGDQDPVFRLRVRDKAGLIGEDELRLVLGEPDAAMDDGQDKDGLDNPDGDGGQSSGGGGGGCVMTSGAGLGLEWVLLAAAALAWRMRRMTIKGGRS
ncbi:PKD domain-containing protein [Desulfocurvibacter africanus]|uniref:PKD domain-containing protein n=1 Tax=Desulfocurvibacter africanus TaxID=873 RepID=UPI0003FE4ECB|nr:lectin like domain-containing protein [Desulfocurvibacter africanus]